MEDVDLDRFWHQRNVLVTGATGLLGSWLVERLVEYGASVVCLVRDWVPNSRLITGGTYDHVTVVRGDLESLDVARHRLSSRRPDDCGGGQPFTAFDVRVEYQRDMDPPRGLPANTSFCRAHHRGVERQGLRRP